MVPGWPRLTSVVAPGTCVVDVLEGRVGEQAAEVGGDGAQVGVALHQGRGQAVAALQRRGRHDVPHPQRRVLVRHAEEGAREVRC